MLTFEWWTIPLAVESAVICASVITASLKNIPGAPLAAVSFGIVGTLTCSLLAFCCYVFAG